MEVFSYVNPNTRPAEGEDDVRGVANEVKTGTTTTYYYVNADIHVDSTADGDTETNRRKMHEVTAKIPEATDYKHIHFGVWAALGKLRRTVLQELSDLGIGFVQNFSGEGLTPIGGGSDDMPNGGEATYNGNWVAAVQKADEEGNGAISLEHGVADLTANFEMGDITATLIGLATLSGDISGNTFDGTKAVLAMRSPSSV